MIGKADSDYAYSRNRNETLERLNRLRTLSQLHGTPKSLLTRLDKRLAVVSDQKRILAAQKRAVNRRKAEEKRTRLFREENSLFNNLRNLLRTTPSVRAAIDKAAEALLQRLPYPEWDRQQALSLRPSVGVSKQIQQWVCNNVAGAGYKLWSAQYRDTESSELTCDLWWQKDGTFRTTKGVVIRYQELQRCLKLWKARRLIGETVDNRYHVLRNDESVLIIGCHCFLQETVQRIWERYAEKSQEQIAHEESMRKQETEEYIHLVMQPLLKLVQREYRKFNQDQPT